MRTMKMIAFFICFTTIISSYKLANQEPQNTIFLIGDSTMADKLPIDAPETGWGMVFPEYFTNAVKIENHAVNGRSTKSFINQGLWKNVISKVKKGDWVIIQFGHNDSKVSDTTRFADAHTTYYTNLIRYVNETRAKGGNPLLITPVMRRKFDENGQFIDQHGDYPSVVKLVANELKVPFIDLHTKSQKIIENHGVTGSKRIFMHYVGGIFPKFPNGINDDTHFSYYGASLMASLVAEGILENNISLKNFLKKSAFKDKYIFDLPKYYTPVFRKDTFNIVRYGAIPNGQTINTNAINQAIDMANKAGGGTVLIPNGLWLTGPISLKSNVNLHVSQGALLQFSRNYDDYPIVKTTWEGEEAYRCQAPISGTDLENIGITGKGVIDGSGDMWRAIKKSKQTEDQWERLTKSGVLNDAKDMWYPTEKSLKGAQMQGGSRINNGKRIADYADVKDFLRPNMVSLTRCENILMEDINIQNSPAWTIHPLLCNHISVKNVSVKNPWYAQNSDAIDLESCRNGLLENCTFDTGDDGITIKSGRDEQGRKRGVPTENFIIKDCKVYHAHGGFVIGSEMSGGVKNMYVSNCTFLGTDVGLRFKTARGRGGVVEQIYVNNIQMSAILGEAIIFDMYYAAKDPVILKGEKVELPTIEMKPLNEGTPQFKNFYLQNITCLGAETGLKIRGLPEMAVKNVWIENAILTANKGMLCIEADNINLKNVSFLAKEKTAIQVQNSKNILLDNISIKENSDIFIDISGERNQHIKLQNSDTSKAKKVVELGAKVSSSVFEKK